MDGIGPFDYLVKEASNDFFQDAAEGIAKEADTLGQILARVKRVKPKIKKAKPALRGQGKSQQRQLRGEHGLTKKPTKADKAVAKAMATAKGGGYGHGAKLAMLVYQSNVQGLDKQATDRLASLSTDSYPELLSCVAASAFWEPLGMTKAACLYLDSMEKAGADDYDLDYVANHLLGDSLQTDIIIEAVMEKQAGAEESLEELIEKLSFAPTVARLFKPFVSGGRMAAKAGRAVASTAGKAGRGLKGAYQRSAAKPPKRRFERLSKSLVGGSLGGRIKRPFVGALAGMRQWKGSRLARRSAIQKADIAKTKQQIAKAKKGLKPGSEIAAGTQLQGLRKTLEKQHLKRGKTKAKIKDLEAKADVTRVKAKKSRKEGGKAAKGAVEKAEAAAAASKVSGGAKSIPKSPPVGDKIRVDAYRRYEAGLAAGTLRKGAPPPVGYSSWKSGGRKAAKGAVEKAEAAAAASKVSGGAKSIPKSPAAAPAAAGKGKGKKKYKEAKKGKGEAPGPPSANKPPPGATPESVKGKPGVGDAWKKWQSDGWASLSAAEKHKIYTAAGVAFVGQRVVLGREDRIL
jgi:hypothetical protein